MLPPSRGADQHPRAVRVAKAPLGCKLRSVVATTQHHDTLAGIRLLDLRRQQIDGAEISGKDNNLLFGISPPECSKRQ